MAKPPPQPLTEYRIKGVLLGECNTQELWDGYYRGMHAICAIVRELQRRSQFAASTGAQHEGCPYDDPLPDDLKSGAETYWTKQKEQRTARKLRKQGVIPWSNSDRK